MKATTYNARNDYYSIAAGLAALLLLALLNFSSSGVVRNGGDDEGSGIGGTGRMPTPGSESGFGGTGFKPFLGMNDASEIEILTSPLQRDSGIAAELVLDIAPVQAIERSPVPDAAIVSNDTLGTRDSSAIDITEAIQRDISTNSLALQQIRQQVTAAQPPAANTIAIHAEPVVSETESTPTAEPRDTAVTWDSVARLLASRVENTANQDELGARMSEVSYDENGDRLDRPERIQRPQLPPVQRIRPVQRAAILPPRVKPLRL